MISYLHNIRTVFFHCKCFVDSCTTDISQFINQWKHASLEFKFRAGYLDNVVLSVTIESVFHTIERNDVRITKSDRYKSQQTDSSVDRVLLSSREI